jgi:hypothetical protein
MGYKAVCELKRLLYFGILIVAVEGGEEYVLGQRSCVHECGTL